MKHKTTTMLVAACLAAPTAALAIQQGDESTNSNDQSQANISAPERLDSLSGIWEVNVEINPRA